MLSVVQEKKKLSKAKMQNESLLLYKSSGIYIK